MRTQKDNLQNEHAPAIGSLTNTKKKAYATPEMRFFGSFTTLTQGAGRAGNDGTTSSTKN